jgi:hypothetical protein
MNKLSAIAKVGLLALAGALAFLGASRWAGASADAIVGLAGAVVGAVIAASVQFVMSRSEQLDRYRLAAIDRRLQVHQEAFALWRKLISKVHRENEIGDVVMECQTWWDNNCLYLEEKARKAFRIAYMCALNHKDFLRGRSNRELIEKNWADIIAAGDALADAVALPPVGDLVAEYEKKALGNDGA